MNALETELLGARLDTAPEAWNDRRNLRRAFVRGGVVVALSLVSCLVPLALFAWVVVPVSIFEFWCRGRVHTARDAVVATVACFVVAFGAIFYTYVQIQYFREVLASHSPGDACTVMIGRLERWAFGDGGGVDEIVVIFYFAQTAALGLASAFVRRLRPPASEAIAIFGLVLLVPASDWTAYGLLRGAPFRIEGVPGYIFGSLACSGLLLCGASVSAAAFAYLWGKADEFDQWMWPTATQAQAAVGAGDAADSSSRSASTGNTRANP